MFRGFLGHPDTDRPPAGPSRAEALRDLLLRVALDMEGELLVELPFDPVSGHERPHSQQQVAEIHVTSPKRREGGTVTPAS